MRSVGESSASAAATPHARRAGQGAQKVGMLAPYADTPGVKAMFKEASKIFGADLLEIVESGPAEKLNDTRGPASGPGSGRRRGRRVRAV